MALGEHNETLVGCFEESVQFAEVGVLFYSYLMPLLVIIGMAGNIISMVILFRCKKLTYLIIGLVLADTFYLVCFSVKVVDFNIIFHGGNFCKKGVVDPLQVMAVCYLGIAISWNIVLFMTIERCVAVFKPLKARTIFSESMELKITLTIYVVCVGLFVPGFCFINETNNYVMAGNETMLSEYDSVVMRFQHSSGMAYSYIIHIFIGFTYLATFIANFILIIGYRRYTSRNLGFINEHIRKQRIKQSTKFTKSSIITGLILMASCLPMEIAISIVLTGDHKGHVGSDITQKLLSLTALFMSLINGSKCLFVHLLSTREFRNSFKRMFHCRACYKEGHLYLPKEQSKISGLSRTDVTATMTLQQSDISTCT